MDNQDLLKQIIDELRAIRCLLVLHLQEPNFLEDTELDARTGYALLQRNIHYPNPRKSEITEALQHKLAELAESGINLESF